MQASYIFFKLQTSDMVCIVERATGQRRPGRTLCLPIIHPLVLPHGSLVKWMTIGQLKESSIWNTDSQLVMKKLVSLRYYSIVDMDKIHVRKRNTTICYFFLLSTNVHL